MEFFNTARAVKLRSHLDKYLVADDNMESVRQSRNGTSRKARWTVELVENKRHVIRLKSCHGLYLTATDLPFLLGMTGKKVVQAEADKLVDWKFEWEPIRDGFQVKLRTWCAKYLRANGGPPPWRNSLTHDDPTKSTTQNWILWDVLEAEVPASESLTDFLLSQQSSFSSFSDEPNGSEYGSPVSMFSTKSPRIMSPKPSSKNLVMTPKPSLKNLVMTPKPSSKNLAKQISTHCMGTSEAEYVAFEEKVKRTVYLDNTSPQVTESVMRTALSQFGNVKSVQFIPNYLESRNIPHCALVEMENPKQASVIVKEIAEFPFMILGMPRPVRARPAVANMFDERPAMPGRRIECHWLEPEDPNFEVAKKLKELHGRHTAEAAFLLKKQLEEEEKLAKMQNETLKANYKKYEMVDSVMSDGTARRLARRYNIRVSDD